MCFVMAGVVTEIETPAQPSDTASQQNYLWDLWINILQPIKAQWTCYTGCLIIANHVTCCFLLDMSAYLYFCVELPESL